MQSISYPVSLQPLLFTSEDLSPCFFFQPTEEELSFLEIWENLGRLRLDAMREEAVQGVPDILFFQCWQCML